MMRSASSALPARRTAGTALSQGVIATPLGPLTALAGDAGLMGLWFDHQQHGPGALDAPVDDDQRWIAQARDELERYFAGRLRRFEVALAHRVIGENGTLTGYAGGLHRKQALLDIEGVVLAPGARHDAQPALL